MRSELKNLIRNDYTVIPNSVLKDLSLSSQARFLYCVLASKPDDWKFYNDHLASEIGCSVDTLRKYLGELISAGWLEKQEGMRVRGKFTPNKYTLKATKITVSEKTRHGKNPTRKKPGIEQEVLKLRSNIEQEVFNTYSQNGEKSPFLGSEGEKLKLGEFSAPNQEIPEKGVFDYWNSKPGLIHHRNFQKFKKHISSQLKLYALEELKQAISNYSLVLNDDKFFWTYKWTLHQFLTQKNAIDRFLPGNFNEKDYLRREFKGRQEGFEQEVDFSEYDKPDVIDE